MIIFFSWLFEHKVKKNSIYLNSFCNIINVFTATFDQLYATTVNKRKKKTCRPQTFEMIVYSSIVFGNAV